MFDFNTIIFWRSCFYRINTHLQFYLQFYFHMGSQILEFPWWSSFTYQKFENSDKVIKNYTNNGYKYFLFY